jgi:hypothetical protein
MRQKTNDGGRLGQANVAHEFAFYSEKFAFGGSFFFTFSSTYKYDMTRLAKRLKAGLCSTSS